jgi:hypothetical protein
VTKESKTRLKASASSPRELTATRCEVRIPRFWNARRRSARSMRLCSEASEAVYTEPALDCMHASLPSFTHGRRARAKRGLLKRRNAPRRSDVMKSPQRRVFELRSLATRS